MTDAPSTFPHLREVQRLYWHPDCVLTPIARFLVGYLLNRMHSDYTGAFPSVDCMCDDTGYGRDTIIKYTKEIVDSGILERKAGRKGMYTYRVKDIDKIGEMLALKMGELVKQYWQDIKVKDEPLNGGSGRPVGAVDQSAPSTATSRRRRPQPVGAVDPERLSGKAPLKAHLGQPTVDPATNTQLAPTGDSKTSDSQVGAELQVQEPEVVDFAEGIAWVDEASIPPTYSQGVWFDRTLGKLSLVNNDKGRAFYRGLRDEAYAPEVIQRGLIAAGAKAPSVRARNGGLEALVRTYVGYARERDESNRARSAARETAFQRPRQFQP